MGAAGPTLPIGHSRDAGQDEKSCAEVNQRSQSIWHFALSFLEKGPRRSTGRSGAVTGESGVQRKINRDIRANVRARSLLPTFATE
jgi:hypothetical protein